MEPKYINTFVSIRSVAVVDMVGGRLTSVEDARMLLDYAKLHDCYFLDFEDVEFLSIQFIIGIIDINNDIILVGADHLIPELYREDFNLLTARRLISYEPKSL